MTWTYCHDPIGVKYYPKEFSKDPDLMVMDYWTNEAGVRIGFFGHAKGASIFTYKYGDVNFTFDVGRASGQGSEGATERTLGPICQVFITESQPGHLGSRYGQFEIKNIREVLLQFRDPRFPSPINIEKVTFYPSDEAFNNSYKEKSGG